MLCFTLSSVPLRQITGYLINFSGLINLSDPFQITHYLERRYALFVGYLGNLINISDIDFKIHSQSFHNYSETNSSSISPIKRERCEAHNYTFLLSRSILLEERVFYLAVSPLFPATCLHMQSVRRLLGDERAGANRCA